MRYRGNAFGLLNGCYCHGFLVIDSFCNLFPNTKQNKRCNHFGGQSSSIHVIQKYASPSSISYSPYCFITSLLTIYSLWPFSDYDFSISFQSGFCFPSLLCSSLSTRQAFGEMKWWPDRGKRRGRRRKEGKRGARERESERANRESEECYMETERERLEEEGGGGNKDCEESAKN